MLATGSGSWSGFESGLGLASVSGTVLAPGSGSGSEMGSGSALESGRSAPGSNGRSELASGLVLSLGSGPRVPELGLFHPAGWVQHWVPASAPSSK